MNSLTVFQFESQAIEIVVIEGSPWFNASQAAKALGYTNPSKALQDNVSAKYNQQLDLGRRGSKPNFISEPGLYQLIMRSNLPSAERFQEWIFEEVLPAIRKTGSYSTHSPAPALTQIEMLAAIAQQMVEQERRQREQERVLAQLVANKEQAEQELKALPLAEEPAAEIPTRGRINMIVRNYAQRTNVAYQAIWSKLYLELYYRYKFDVKARCRNSGRKPLEQIEADGMLEALYAIASEVLV